MIKKLTIENFGPFNEPVTFDFSNKSVDSRLTHFINNNKISKITGIFGKNGSGKTQLAQAIITIKDILTRDNGLKTYRKHQTNQINALTNINIHSKQINTIFNVEIVMLDYEFYYHIEYNTNGIVKESLKYKWYKKGNKKTIFNRNGNIVGDEVINSVHSAIVVFNTNSKNKEHLNKFLNFWNNVNFIDDIRLKHSDILNWVFSNIEHYLKTNKKWSHISLEEYKNKHIYPFLKEADLNVKKFRIHRVPRIKGNPDQFDYVISAEDYEINQAWEKGLYKFNFSQGTIHYITLLIAIQFVNQFGGVLFVDELGSNTHMEVTKLLIELMSNDKSNTKAQFIWNSSQISLIEDLDESQLLFMDNFQGQGSDIKKVTKTETRNRSIYNKFKNGTFFGTPNIDHLIVEDIYG